MLIENLFPQAIGHFSLDRDLTVEELSFIKNQDTVKNIGNLTSKDCYLLEKHPLKSLKEFFKNSLEKYFLHVYAPETNVNLKITQSWSNYTNSGEFHHKHIHSNSFVSGVFFVQTDPALDKIFFYRNESPFSIFSEKYNMYNSEAWWYPATQGKLILFPSTTQHSVETVTTKQRISISFNTFFVGHLGRDEDLTSLHLT